MSTPQSDIAAPAASVATSVSELPMAHEPGPGLRAGRIGVLGIAFFVVAAVGPMAAIVGASGLVFAANGAATPSTYVIAALLFAVFSVGYVAMSRHVSNAGGFVAYVARGLGTRAAGAAAGMAVLTYLTVACSLYGVFSVIAEGTLDAELGIHLPGTVWLFATLALVSGLAWWGVDVSLRTLGVLLLCEVIVLLVLDIAVIADGGASGNSVSGFAPSSMFGSGFGIALLWCAACFTGFEATVVFSEEARRPRRTIPRATYLSIAFIGGFYALTTWALSNAWGVDRIQQTAIERPADFIFAATGEYVGSGWSSIMQVLVVTSFLAMLLGFHNLFARYVFALGRARMLPAAMGVADRRSGSPRRAALAIGVAELIVIGGFLLFGADAYTVLYAWLIALGTVTLLVVLALTSVAILAFFARTRVERGLWSTRVAPAVALAGFVAVTYLAIDNYAALLGGQGGVARWLLLLIPVVAVAGWVGADRRGRDGEVDFAARLS
jgi:amino acid transporter